jgi:two-component sensor histidine kinase
MKPSSIFIVAICWLGLSYRGRTQIPATPYRFQSAPAYHPPGWYPPGHQRLLLQLSGTYYHSYRNADIDLDTSFLHAARYLNISRIILLNEAFEQGIPTNSAPWFDRQDPDAANRALPGTHGVEHLRLLTLLGAYYAFQPNAWARYRDSALHYLNTALAESKSLNKLNWYRQILCVLGKLYITSDQPQRGIDYFKECISACRSTGDLPTEAKAWAWWGLYESYSSSGNQARIDIFRLAQDLYRKIGHPEGQITTLTDIGYLYVSEVQLQKGTEEFKAALGLEDSIGFAYTHYTTDNIAMNGFFQHQYGQPLTYTLQSINTAEGLRDSVPLASLYCRLSDLYQLLDVKYPESGKWAIKAADRMLIDKDNTYLYPILANINSSPLDSASALAAIAKMRYYARICPPVSTTSLLEYDFTISLYFEALSQYDSAEPHILEAVRLEKQITSQRGSINSQLAECRLAKLYFEKKEYGKAEHYAQRFLAEYNSSLGLSHELQAEYEIALIDSINGNYQAGMRHLNNYIHLLDSNLNVQSQRLGEDMAVQYQTQQKENEISRLQQAYDIRRSRLKQAEITRRMAIASSLLLLVILILLYGRYRTKNRNNKEINEKNSALQRLVQEKEWLLKEIHHRVKNNLHVITSLLESQSAYAEHKAQKAIRDSQHRVHSMSLIHQKLYQGRNMASIDFGEYIRELVQYLRESFATDGQIEYSIEKDPIEIGASQAAHLGLILNEAITNAIKYAFPDHRKGMIKIIAIQQADDHLLLEVRDNGIGLPADFDLNKIRSLGMRLMKGLSEDYDAQFTISSENGTIISLLCKLEPIYEQTSPDR